MNGWIVFQLLVDVALFAIIVIYLVRSGEQDKTEIEDIASRQEVSSPEVDPDQIEKLLDELARLVMRAEKVAVRIEKGVESATGKTEEKPAIARDDKILPEGKPTPAKRGSKAYEKNRMEDEQYGKAAKLIKKGMSNEDIGRMVGLPPHEINLIRRIGS